MGEFTISKFAAINPTNEQCELVRKMVNRFFEWGNSAHDLVKQTPSWLYKFFCDVYEHEDDFYVNDWDEFDGINESNIKLFVVNACFNTLHGFVTLEALNAVAFGGE
tara:strand:+ start:1636 stop:1956 length:321 start_codon:yes stop_codon:yes gene_type:complete